MFELLVFLVAIIVVGNVALRWRDRLRERSYGVLARRLGLRYSADDPFELDRLPFELLRTGGAAKVTNVAWGDVHGLPVTAFEYRRLSRETMDKGEIPWAFSCVMTTLAIVAPQLKIERQSEEAYQLGRAIGAAERVRTESNEFERAFQIRCDDRRFALALLDPAVMGWLLDTPGTWSFELFGNRMLCFSPLRPLAEWESLITSLRDLRDRIPSVVWSVASVSAPTEDSLRRGALPGDPPARRPVPIRYIVVAGVILSIAASSLMLLWLLQRALEEGGVL